MEKKDVERMVYEIYNNSLIAAGKGYDEDGKVYQAVELTRSVYMDTASVPEFKLAEALLELFLQKKVGVTSGFLDEDEYSGLSQEEKGQLGIEMFINPKELFFNGKIRPDIVFRKGSGNYIVIEVDSFMYHSNQEQLLKDKVRERKIQSLGYPVFRYAAKECLDGNQWETAIEIFKILKDKKFV